MVNINSFRSLIGKRFGTAEFKAAIEEFGQKLGKPVTYELMDALHPDDCSENDRLRRLYSNEKILVIYSGDPILIPLVSYRVCAPYDEPEYRDKYPDGDEHYIMPRYQITKDFDKSLTSYLLYYLSITAHRYLEIIKSFYITPPGAELQYDKESVALRTKDELEELLNLKTTFDHSIEAEGPLRNQKRHSEYQYKTLVKNITNILIRRAEPHAEATTHHAVEKAFRNSTRRIETRIEHKIPIHGPNDEMELTIRCLILAMKLVVHDFNKLNGREIDEKEFASDKKEFDTLVQYLLVYAEFAATRSDGKIVEPTDSQIKEFTKVLKEIRGEIAKVGGVLSRVPKINIESGEEPEVAMLKAIEEAFAKRTINGYAMLHNRIQKITRCAYYIDLCHKTINSEIRGSRPELELTIQEFVDLSKIKIFTSAASKEYKQVKVDYFDTTKKLCNEISNGKHMLRDEQKAALFEFINVVTSMTETKRRQEDSVDKIKAVISGNFRE